MEKRTGPRTGRRTLLTSGISATVLAISGCLRLNDGGTEDTDGDGVPDSEDYAPRDPDVQREGQANDTDAPSDSSTDSPTESSTETESNLETVFSDGFDNEEIGPGWNVTNGGFIEESGFIRGANTEFLDLIYHEASQPYHVVEYEYRHGKELDNGSSITITTRNSNANSVDYDPDQSPAGFVDTIRVKHNSASGPWRAALVYTPENSDGTGEVNGEPLITWGDASNINDDWHTYRVERGRNELRLFVDGELAGTADTQLPDTSWIGRSGMTFWATSYKIRRWEQHSLR